MNQHSTAGIHSIAEYLPPRVATVGELHQRGLLRGSPETLKSFGFDTVHLAGEESNIDMAIASATRRRSTPARRSGMEMADLPTVPFSSSTAYRISSSIPRLSFKPSSIFPTHLSSASTSSAARPYSRR